MLELNVQHPNILEFYYFENLYFCSDICISRSFSIVYFLCEILMLQFQEHQKLWSGIWAGVFFTLCYLYPRRFLSFSLQKIVEKQDKNEYQLYTQVRQLQSEKRKQQQLVATLRQELLNTQKENKELLRVNEIFVEEIEVLHLMLPRKSRLHLPCGFGHIYRRNP